MSPFIFALIHTHARKVKEYFTTGSLAGFTLSLYEFSPRYFSVINETLFIKETSVYLEVWKYNEQLATGLQMTGLLYSFSALYSLFIIIYCINFNKRFFLFHIKFSILYFFRILSDWNTNECIFCRNLGSAFFTIYINLLIHC